MAKPDLSKITYDTFRIILGVVFLSSGIGKFYGTSGLIGPGWMFAELKPYSLLLFAVFVALAEIIIGYILLIRRFSTLGAVMLFPMILNILIVVISLKWQGTPLIDSVFLAMNLYLLHFDRRKLLPVLGIQSSEELKSIVSETWPYLLVLIVILAGVLLSFWFGPEFRLLTRTGLAGLVGVVLYKAWKNNNRHTLN